MCLRGKRRGKGGGPIYQELLLVSGWFGVTESVYAEEVES